MRLMLARLHPHLTSSTNFSKRQSAYRQGHSTETTLLDVLDSVHTAADNKEVALLIGLDLSAAFDAACHLTLTKWLHRETNLEVGVPQGSVLRLLLFAVYGSNSTWLDST